MTASKYPDTAPDALRGRLQEVDLYEVEGALRVGDLIFTRIPWSPFRQVADVTGTWTNHVGIVVGFRRAGAIIAESRVPISCHTGFARFVRRSDQRRVAVLRLPRPLSQMEVERLRRAARQRLDRFYDTGFNLRSRRQFCSRFVREVLQEATHQSVGDIETFADLLARHPAAELRLWQLWYFGRIPWDRSTVTPASLYHSPDLEVVFDGQLRPCTRIPGRIFRSGQTGTNGPGAEPPAV